MKFRRSEFWFTCLLLLLPAASVQGQGTGFEFRGIPATIEELDLGFDLKGKWTGQVDLQPSRP